MTTSAASPSEVPGQSDDAPSKISESLLALQLLLVLLVVSLFRIEDQQGLFAVLVLAAVGFIIHRRLQPNRRPAFFLALSLASFPIAFYAQAAHFEGWTSPLSFEFAWSRTAWVFGLGALILAVAHLPVAFGVRVGLLALLGGTLAAWRSDDFVQSWASLGSILTGWEADSEAAFWPVLGSIFMLRLWVYLRETRREKRPAPWPQRLSYFFLIPNACFPFFPIIDYRRFRDGYVDDESGRVAQRGLSWMLRGIIHLLLYRSVKVYLLPGTYDLIDVEYLALFLVTNYALYLRISGYFHIITGLLHLFGFDLPRTHDRYFLASSLSDIWRRINIYWKDFLTEHVFFPMFFALRALPRWGAVVLGVLVVFLATWLLHSWQAFWLRGSFPIELRDAVLWLSAGSLVAINSVWQFRAAAKHVARSEEVTFASALRLSLQVAATFLAVSFFWACWTVPQFPQLVAAIGSTGGFTPHGIAVVGGVLVVTIAIGTAVQVISHGVGRRGISAESRLDRAPGLCLASLGLLAVLGTPQTHRYFGHTVENHIAALRSDSQTAAELGQEVEGYYESIADVQLQSDPLLATTRRNFQADQTMWSDVTRTRNDLVETEMIPGWKGTLAGVPFHVNRWGMRDDDISRRKPPNVDRIAVVGSSATMGYGVTEDADFETLLERRMNRELASEDRRIELLNFGTGGYVALQWAAALDEKVYPFEPDVMLYIVHQGELLGSSRHLAKCQQLGFPLPYPCLEEIIKNAGITEGSTWVAAELRLHPRRSEILRCIYRGIVNDCRRRGVRPMWVYLPMPAVSQVPESMGDLLVQIARDAGFDVIDLTDWDDGYSPQEVIFDGHHHPNGLGHRLIAERLYDELQRHSHVLSFRRESAN